MNNKDLLFDLFDLIWFELSVSQSETKRSRRTLVQNQHANELVNLHQRIALYKSYLLLLLLLTSARKPSHKHNRPESPTVTLTWHASKYKVHKRHRNYIVKDDVTWCFTPSQSTITVISGRSQGWPCYHSSGAVWESRWPSWAVRPNEPSGFRGRKELLNHASALVTTCP